MRGAVVHAPGGEQIDQRRLGAAPGELRLERLAGFEGVAEIGGHDAVDVGGEHGEGGERPQGREQDEAPREAGGTRPRRTPHAGRLPPPHAEGGERAAAGGAQNSSR